MKQKTDEGKNVVSCRITYTCGRCANVQVRRYAARDGLLEIPQMYCGQCGRMNSLVTMSEVVSEVRCETPNGSAKTSGLERCTEVSEAGSAAGAVEQPATGRVDTGEAGAGVQSTGAGRAGGMPEPPEKPKNTGGQAKQR